MDPTSDQGVPPVPKGRLDPKQLPNVRSLGKGLSGFIYQTTWSGQGRYARKDFPLRSLKRSRVFEDEAKVLLELDHPNLVRCLGYTVGKSSSSLVQEYVDDDLQNIVQRRIEAQQMNSTSQSRVVDNFEGIKSLLSSKGKGSTGLADGMPRNNCQFEMREAEDIISQIAAGMKYLHDNKIAHGDLKPKNVLLSLDESGKTKGVKIADYGLCGTKKLIRLVSKRTRHFEILTWKAPERFEELLGPVTEDSDHPFTDSDIDSDEDMGRDDDFPRSSPAMADVYSFGLTCSYVLGAKLVFPELSLTQLRGERQRDLCFSLPPTCPDYLQSMTASCLRSDPVSRPTFSAICSTLTEYGGERRSVDAEGKMKAVFTSHNHGDETDAASDKSASTSLYSPQDLSFLSIKKPGPQVEETEFNWKWGGEGIKELKSITHLNLTGCSSVMELLDGIMELKSLTHLILRECSSLKELPEGIKELKSLTHLDLMECSSLKELPEGIKELKSLTHLDLRWCSSLEELPEGIKELKSLTHLDLRMCSSLKELPEGIKELKSLTHLDLSWCSSLEELPEGIKELKSLTHLNLRNSSSLKKLPEGIQEALNQCVIFL